MSNKQEYFTNRSRRVFAASDEAARQFRHKAIGTHHVLLGLSRYADDKSAQVLHSLSLDADRIHVAIEELYPSEEPDDENLKLEDEVNQALKLAVTEARRWRHQGVDTEHLLLALTLQKNSTAVRVLSHLGANLVLVHDRAMHFLGEPRIIETPPQEEQAKTELTPGLRQVWVWRKDVEAHGVYYETHPTRFSQLRALFRKNNPVDTTPS